MTASSETRTAYYCLLLFSIIGSLLISASIISQTQHAADLRWIIVALFGLGIIKITSLHFDNQGHIITITVSDIFVYISLLLAGNDAAIIVAAISCYAEVHKSTKTRLLLAFNIAAASISLFFASIIAASIFGDLKSLANHQATFFKYILSLSCLALAHWLVNAVIVIGVQKLRGVNITWKVCKETYAWSLVTNLTGVAMAAAVYALILYFGMWAVIFSIPMLLACQMLTRPYIKNIEAARRHTEEIRDIHKRTLEAFATAVDAKDQITHDHVRRVQIYATGMARLLKLSDAEIEALRAGALLHDIGKIAVPDYILNKPGKLTAAEFDKMKIHTIAGAQILDQINFPYPLVPVVRHHHERWDGRGYPDGLAGEAIPLTARILTVVDCFDAFRQDRQYRKGMTRQEALDLLIKDRGVFYDPTIVDLFIENLPTFEAEIAAIKEEEHVFKPVAVTESDAIRQATPAAGLMEEKPKVKESAYLKTILDSHQQGQEMYALFEMTRKLVGVIDAAQILNIIGTQLKTVVPHETCALFMLAEDGGTVHPAYAGGLHADIFRKHAVRPGEGVTGWTIANNTASLNANPMLDFSCLGIEGEIPQYRTMCVLPLSKDEKVYGALAVYSQSLEAYSIIYLESLERIATMAADSLHSAWLYEEARRKLLTDAQTGLPSEQALPELFAQAASASTSLSLIKVSIETEASENPAAMTEVIQKAAGTIRQQLRNTDLLARQQDGTFVLLLPETDRDALCEIAARIESTLPGRISLGQAQFNNDGQTLTELLAAAHARQMADLSAHQSLRQFEAAATFRPN